MYSQPFDHIPVWAVFIVTVVLFIISAEGGFRIGKYISSRREPIRKSQVGTILGASLGLLAFLLAITFSMAGSRFDNRKQLVLDEANAIETTYLRAKMLPEPFRMEFQALLRKYVDVRAEIQNVEWETIPQLIAKSEELQALLWSKAVDLVEELPISVVTGLFIQSLNEVLDLHGKRVTTSLINRMSPSIILTLYFVAFLSMAMMGYQSGLAGLRTLVSGFALMLAFSAVLMLITDLERPSQKIFNVSQQAMVNLKAKVSQMP